MRQFIERLEQITHDVNTAESKRAKVMGFMQDCPAICFIKDATTGQYQYVNTAYRQVITVDPIGRTDVELFDLKLAKIFVEHDLNVLSKGEPFVVLESLPIIDRDKPVCFLMLKFLIVNGDRSIGGLGIEVPESLQDQFAK